MLLQLGLPRFDRDCWLANRSKEIKIHPRYHALAPSQWEPLPESTSIYYDDSDSILTNLLVQSGYLAADIWQNQKPNYNFAVESTTETQESAFYISESQYSRVRLNCSINPVCYVPRP